MYKSLRLVFICTGNICRSPMAEGIARGAVRELYPALSEEVEISSAGVAALDGEPATAGAIEAMRLRALEMEERGSWTRADPAYEVEDPLGMSPAGYVGAADAMEKPILDMLKALL